MIVINFSKKHYQVVLEDGKIIDCYTDKEFDYEIIKKIWED